MSRVKPIELSSRPELKSVFEGAVRTMGFMPEDALIMAHCVDILKANGAMVGAILGQGNVPPGLKRMIGFITSQSSGCEYCSAHTSYSADKYGISDEQMNAIWEYESSDLFTKKEKAAIRLAHHAGMHPNSATDADFSELRKYFNEAEIVEIVSTIALYGFFNKFNDTMKTAVETEPMKAYKRLITKTA